MTGTHVSVSVGASPWNLKVSFYYERHTFVYKIIKFIFWTPWRVDLIWIRLFIRALRELSVKVE